MKKPQGIIDYLFDGLHLFFIGILVGILVGILIGVPIQLKQESNGIKIQWESLI
jgi:hypothetical protein